MKIRIEVVDEMELGVELELVHGDIDQPVNVEAAIENNFTARMADLEEFYDSASVAIREVQEVIADTACDDASKLLLISEILDTSPDQPLEVGDYQSPHDGVV